jgi:hypothetical protein
VFSHRGKPIKEVSSRPWYAALRAAGIEDFGWHDLRHTWASWHVQNGTPLYALQEMGGWSSVEIVRRYAHLAADHLAPFAERLCVACRGTPHNYVTVRKMKGPASLQALDCLVAGTRFRNWKQSHFGLG